MQKLYLTQNFGQNFKPIQSMVKSLYWIKENDTDQRLLVQRTEPSGLSVILHSADFFSKRVTTIYAADVKDLYVKGDYLFTTKKTSKGVLELYVSYKLGKQHKCMFDTRLEHRSYYIADVTSNRALVAVSHTNTVSHLYVSENLDGGQGAVQFTLSLEEVFCYFPNTTWHDTWLQ